MNTSTIRVLRPLLAEHAQARLAIAKRATEMDVPVRFRSETAAQEFGIGLKKNAHARNSSGNAGKDSVAPQHAISSSDHDSAEDCCRSRANLASCAGPSFSTTARNGPKLAMSSGDSGGPKLCFPEATGGSAAASSRR